METNNSVGLSWRNTQVQMFVANVCILEVNYEPLAESIKDYLVEVFLFDFPVTMHSRSELVPFRFRNKYSAWVIIRVGGWSFLFIFDMFFLSKPGSILVLFDNCVHIAPSNTFVPSWSLVFRIFLRLSVEELCFRLRLSNPHYTSIDVITVIISNGNFISLSGLSSGLFLSSLIFHFYNFFFWWLNFLYHRVFHWRRILINFWTQVTFRARRAFLTDSEVRFWTARLFVGLLRIWTTISSSFLYGLRLFLRFCSLFFSDFSLFWRNFAYFLNCAIV